MSYDLLLNTSSNYDLPIQPGGVPLVIHVSQYDNNSRQLVFRLRSPDGPLNLPSGANAEVRGTKPDGKGFSYTAALNGTTVSVTVTEQMTAVAGDVVCELVLNRQNGNTTTQLATANFVLAVERAALDRDTIPSESEIRQIYEIADKVDALIAAARRIERAQLIPGGGGGSGGDGGGTNLSVVTPEMFGAVGDGIEDDAPALKAALESGFPVYLTQDLYLKSAVTVEDRNVYLDGMGFTIHCHGTNAEGSDDIPRAKVSPLPVFLQICSTFYQGIAEGADVIRYTEKNGIVLNPAFEATSWYKRGYISYHGFNPTPDAEEYAEAETASWYEHRADVKNVNFIATNADHWSVLALRRMCNSTVDNCTFLVDGETDELGVHFHDGRMGLEVDDGHNIVISRVRAEGFLNGRTRRPDGTILETRNFYSHGYGIYICGDAITVSDCIIKQCKCDLVVGGNSNYMTTNVIVNNITHEVREYGETVEVRGLPMRVVQQALDIHEGTSRPIFNNIHVDYFCDYPPLRDENGELLYEKRNKSLNYDDNGNLIKEENKAMTDENGEWVFDAEGNLMYDIGEQPVYDENIPAPINISCPESFLSNVVVHTHTHDMYIIPGAYFGPLVKKVHFRGLYAPNMLIQVSGWGLKKTSDYVPHYFEELHVDGGVIFGVDKALGVSKVRLSNVLCRGFTRNVNYLDAVNCVFRNESKWEGVATITVLREGRFTGCDISSTYSMNNIQGYPAIRAPENSLHMVNCVIRKHPRKRAFNKEQTDLVNVDMVDIHGFTLGHRANEQGYTVGKNCKLGAVRLW